MFRRYSLFESTPPRLSVLPFTTSRRPSVTAKPIIGKVESVPDQQTQTQTQLEPQQLNLLHPNDRNQRKTRSLDNSPVKPENDLVTENCPSSNDYCFYCGYKLIHNNNDKEFGEEKSFNSNSCNNNDKVSKNTNSIDLIDDKIDGSLFSCHKRNSHQQRRVAEEKLGRVNKTNYLTTFKRNCNSNRQQHDQLIRMGRNCENGSCNRLMASSPATSSSSSSSTFRQGLVYQRKKHSLPETVYRRQYSQPGSQPPTIVHNCLMIRRRSEFYDQFNPSLFNRCTVRG